MRLCGYLCHLSKQIEQGVHYIGKSLIYLTRKALLDKAVVELVYKFDENLYRKSIAKVRFKIAEEPLNYSYL